MNEILKIVLVVIGMSVLSSAAATLGYVVFLVHLFYRMNHPKKQKEVFNKTQGLF